MKVLVVTSTYPRWNGDNEPAFVHELCRRLIVRGFKVDVLAPRAPGVQTTEILDGVNVTRYPYFLKRWESLAYDGGIMPKLRQRPARLTLVPFFLLGQVLAVRRELSRGNYDVVHAHWIVPQGLCVAIANPKRWGTRMLTTAHGSDVQGLKGRLFDRVRRFVVAKSDQVTTVSRSLGADLQAYSAAARPAITVASMGIDDEARFTPDPGTVRVDNRVLYVGRLVADKGVAELIKAIALLRERGRDVHLRVAGDGPDRQALASLASDSGIPDHVRFLGALPQEELPDLYRRATLVAVPSFREGLGLTAIEAMACGCPVVASDIPSLREIISDGRTGLLAKPGDTNDLARAVEAVLDDESLRESLASNARSIVSQKFGWSSAVSRYEQLLLQLGTSA